MLLFGMATAMLSTLFVNAISINPDRISLWRHQEKENFKVKGINAGGWLLLESWITRSLFEQFTHISDFPGDEWSLCEYLGKEKAAQLLQTHWANFYTLDDFKEMASYGLNTVRIPIGYWSFDVSENEPFVQGAEEYLDKAISWARISELDVWIDLHGAPGGQNMYDNSGRRGYLSWGTGDTVARTLTIINKIIDKYTSAEYSDVVTAIELINEPDGNKINLDIIKGYYENSYLALRSKSQSTYAVMHDAFKGPAAWNDFFPLSQAPGLLLDIHIYQVFSRDMIVLSPDQHVTAVCNSAQGLVDASLYHTVVVGEFSNAMTDCATWLNGFLTGSRYDGSLGGQPGAGSCLQSYDPGSYDVAQMRRFFEAQIQAYEQADGWIFWTFKTEGSPEWDFRIGVRLGWIPQPLDNLIYKPCGDI